MQMNGYVSLPDNSEDYWWVHVNEQTRDFIHGVEDKRIPPGDDCASQRTLPSAPSHHVDGTSLTES
jgi:hypothetical protein